MSETIRKHLLREALTHLEYGVTEDEIDNALEECIKAAKNTNKNATLNIKLTISPENNGAQITIVTDINAKLPRLPRGKTIFFSTNAELLTRIDPRQNELPGLRVVDDEKPTQFKTANQ